MVDCRYKRNKKKKACKGKKKERKNTRKNKVKVNLLSFIFITQKEENQEKDIHLKVNHQ